MIIRTETPGDYEQVYRLHYMAFGNRVDESELVERIRQSEAFVPDLSIVAELQESIIGHVLVSRAVVVEGSEQYPVLVVAPVAVHPDHQKRGVGKRLLAEALQRCKAQGEVLVLLIGHPSYYPKFGFVPARPYGLELKQFQVSDEVFMVWEATEGSLGRVKGELRYPAAFFG